MKKFSLFLCLLFFFAILLSACNDKGGGGDSADKTGGDDEQPLKGEFITILTGGSSGVYYPLGGALAKIYQEMGANANSQSTAASSANATTLNQGKAEIGFSMGDAASDAYNGTDSFEEQGAQENLRSIASLYPNYLQIVATKESGIKTVEDLEGKNVAVGAPASGTEISAKRVLAAYDMTYDDIDEDFLSFAEGVEGIQNGTIDAVVISSGLPNAGVLELQTSKEIVIVEIAEEKVLKMQEDYPAFFPATVTKDVYDTDRDVPTIGVNNVLLTHKDVSDEVAYEMTKGIFENLDQLKDTHNAAKDIDIEKALENLPAPLHPGAKKYFDEQGISE
ncbi:TAXI family TRAP transporter solute-binding subunit [Lentibacillus sp. Marseille-P4043]|uniref:TAXI family TRAP transporter solute-binding subunit n=1 Tax=Lentibacillus sp. Marseille-P4043 TaxID=2040293 RepID=UPI00131A5B47|nr:TAXI family TRAP transporter solute-binding subunit [Lentibacillus sp. Marseille-P4043]